MGFIVKIIFQGCTPFSPWDEVACWNAHGMRWSKLNDTDSCGVMLTRADNLKQYSVSDSCSDSNTAVGRHGK